MNQRNESIFSFPDVQPKFAVTITDSEFNLLRKLIYEQFGIEISESKKNLLPSRLQKVLRTKGFTTFHEYYEYVVNDKSREALIELVNHISTNHTYFYREKAHFEYFQNHALPEIMERLKAQNQRDIRIWSAGCSSGEEPYMLVILMMEVMSEQYRFWDAGVLATDISRKVLEFAQIGLYPNDRMIYMPKLLTQKFFTRQKDQWLISPEIKKEVTFRRFNLMTRYFPFRKPFQMIFCRNVMIYFDEETRRQLVEKFRQNLIPGGYLYIGHSETIRNHPGFRYIIPALYQRI